ncbi:hypothetical protein C8F01DRAFT_1132100 [Mycena amicta]|nr:hypothetical protein C8F01DRAFT_1132100 [Mycena amicta]
MASDEHARVDPRNEQTVEEEDAEEIPTDANLEAPQERRTETAVSPVLPEIPLTSDLEFDLDSILSPSNPPTTDKVQKRASSVLKLTQENEKLKAELKAMSDRLEAAERRRLALARKEQHIMEPPSS